MTLLAVLCVMFAAAALVSLGVAIGHRLASGNAPFAWPTLTREVEAAEETKREKPVELQP